MFKEQASVQPQLSTGRKSVTLQDILERVKNFFEQTSRSHIRLAAEMLSLGYDTIWRILREQLK
jgi:hypothetical protein